MKLTPKLRPLTVKQRKLVKARAEGKTLKESYDAAGYAPKLKDELKPIEAWQTLKKPNVDRYLQQMLKKHEITVDSALAPIGEALVHDELEMRLKGSDRAIKIMPEFRSASMSLNFHQHLHQQDQEYDL